MLKRYLCAITSPNVSLWLVGLMFLLPFVTMYHQQPIPSFYSEWVAATLGVMAMLTLLRKGAWSSIHIPQIAMTFLGLAAILGMQWLLGMLHSTQYALLVLSYLAWGFLLMVLGSYLRRELGWEKLATTLAWCLVVAGLINAGFVLLQYAARAGLAIFYLPELSSYGAISQANHFADFSALATASLIYLYAKGRFSLKSFSITLVLFLGMLAFSGARSTWLYLTAYTILAIVMQVNAMRQHTGSTAMRSLLRASLFLLPTFALIQLVIYALPGTLATLPAERLMAEVANAGSASARMHIWYDSWRLFLLSPWLGIGAGTMREQSFLLLDHPAAFGAKQVFEHEHNLFVHLLAEMGVGALLITLVGLVAWVRGFEWRKLSRGLGLETWWLIALLAVLGIHSMLEDPLWYAYFLGIAAVLFGAGDEKFVNARLPNKIANQLPQGIGKILTRSALVAMLVLGVANLSTMLIANAKLETWLPSAIKDEVSAQRQPQFFEALHWVHSHSLLAPYAELMYATSLVIDPSQINDKLWLSNSAMRFMPLRNIAYRHVLLLKLQGNHAAAVKQLNRTLIAYRGKFTKELEAMPFKYWQDYLDVLSEARPMPIKGSSENSILQKAK